MKNKVFVFLMCLFFSCDLPEKKIKQPNVIFILVDDLGWKDLGYSGSEFYETPNLDKFSKEGFEFTSAYAASSVCSPTRASIMTGKHPARVNITDWIPGVDPKNKPLLGPEDLHQLPLIETTFAEKLKDIQLEIVIPLRISIATATILQILWRLYIYQLLNKNL